MAANLIFQMIELRLGMALGEKLFEEDVKCNRVQSNKGSLNRGSDHGSELYR
jgi:hypothetical protein